MQIYLPIAELPVNMLLILAMGLTVGFISGMFGIGGGFLMTPLLIFVGISPAVAVASVASHIAASSFTGALTYWRRRALDPALALMLLAGGLLGTAAGVWLFAVLRRFGQLDLTISLSYVILLGTVGALMIAESARAIVRARQGRPSEIRRGGSHMWIHGLPFKLRFKQSKIYVSTIPVWGIGFFIGFIGAIMGIGGGFLLVPMLIYVLRVPTGVVIGTSMVVTLVTMAIATILHAATNHLVDVVLALILMLGGVSGAQFGARAGQKIRSEQLRLLLGLLVLLVGLRFASAGAAAGRALFDPAGGGDMRALRLALALLALVLSATTAAAERLITSLSDYRVSIASNFAGADLVLFGTIERDAATVSRRGGYDVVVTVIGPRQTVRTFRKDRVLGIWVNVESRTFVDAPSYLAVLTNRPVEEIASADVLRRLQVGLEQTLLPQMIGADVADVVRDDPFRMAFLRLRQERGLYLERTNGVTFLTPTVFRAAIPLPADAPIGTYEVDVKLFADATLLAREPSAFELYKIGFEQFVASAAREHGLLYGLSTAGLALFIGWLASVVFRRD